MTNSVRMTERRLRARLADGSLVGLWRLDQARSSVKLSTKGMWGLATVNGVFAEVTGEGVLSDGGRIGGHITVVTVSVDTRNTKRDAHLRSADFLHSEAHPHIVFTAERITPAGDQATVAGTLQIFGHPRPITFPATITASGDDEVGIEAEIQVDRSDFGQASTQMGMVSKKSTVTVSAVFVRH